MQLRRTIIASIGLLALHFAPAAADEARPLFAPEAPGEAGALSAPATADEGGGLFAPDAANKAGALSNGFNHPDWDDKDKIVVGKLRLIGEMSLPHRLNYRNTIVGGLSGLNWNPTTRQWIALSDDRSNNGPSRFYTLDIKYDRKTVREMSVTGLVELRDGQGNLYPQNAVDPESVRQDPHRGTLYWSSEGDIAAGINPSINVATQDGRLRRSFNLRPRYKASSDGLHGPRANNVFEGLALSKNGRTIFAAMEGPLVEDGPMPSVSKGGVVRISTYDAAIGLAGPEYAYVTDPLPPGGSDGSLGVSEILSVTDDSLLVLERFFSGELGNKIRLYLAQRTRVTTDISRKDSLATSRWVPMAKTLVLDFDTLKGVRLDNFEAMSWGPIMPGGNRTLVVLSDDNFNPTQVTKALVFEVGHKRSALSVGLDNEDQ